MNEMAVYNLCLKFSMLIREKVDRSGYLINHQNG